MNDGFARREDAGKHVVHGTLGLLSLFTSSGTLLCCALPATVAMLAGGSAVIAMTSAFPWLIPLSRHKDWIFLAAGAMLLVHGILLFRPKGKVACSVTGGRGCAIAGRFTKVMFWVSAGIVTVGAFVSFALVPILRVIGG